MSDANFPVGPGHAQDRPAAVPHPTFRAGESPVPRWLLSVFGVAVFWAGAYLFTYSGGFDAGVFDFQPKYGAAAGGPAVPPDPKEVGKKLFSANCITCHQANGQGVAGQFPPLAGSEWVNSDATNRLISIVLKGLQGPVQVKGQAYNNAMQAWEAQYTDEQFAAILTYIRSDWGNSGPPVPADAVKLMRDQVKDRKEQWTMAELQKMPPQDVTKGGGTQVAGNKPPAPAAPPPGGAPK
ncbi:MAG TPA: cytochrome c [Chthoniobacterales bacterium]